MTNEKTIYALGFFDGVHRGHGALLRECVRLAAETGAVPGVITFSSHPDTLVFGRTPPLINTIEDRKRLISRLFGIEKVLLLPFDRAMMTMPWQDFYRMLRREYGAAGLVCGHDFSFGSRGEGNAALLAAACRADGIPCTVIPEQRVDGIAVSSTYIRTLLESGDMERAAAFLGHPHLLTGTVVHGRALGRKLGTPTANLLLPDGLLVPRFGVYACRAETGGKTYPAVTNVGTRPTVDGTGVTVEPWLLGFDGDLYGRMLTLEFFRFLRPEQKFPSLEALQAAIRQNAAETLDLLGKG